MTRPKIAFVASGGAAKGIAHLGVLKACEDLGIRPDIYVGASAGALVAATYGQGIALDVLLDSYRFPWQRKYRGPRLTGTMFAGRPRRADLRSLGYLLSGAFSIHALEEYLRRHLPCNDFRKIDRTLLVTATDIDTAERVVFGRGYEERVPISQAVAASCCLPVLFRPYRIGARYFLDGEMVRTLSADLAAQAGADVVIVSNVYRPERTPTGGVSVAERGVQRVLVQSINIVLAEKEKRGIDLYHRLYPKVAFVTVTPPIEKFSFLSVWRTRKMILRGYREGIRELSAAKAAGVFEGARERRRFAAS